MQRKVLFVAALAGLAYGDPASAQTIEQVLTQAYLTNPQLMADRARQRATDENVPRALSNWRPVVSVSSQVGKARERLSQDSNGTTTRTTVDRTPQIANLTITQPLYRGGRTLAETSQAENTVQQGRAQLKVTEQTVLLDTANAYVAVLRDQAVLDLNINNEQVLQRQLDAARDRFQVGEITRTDVAQAEARRARALSDRIQAEGNLTSSRANYLRLVGQPPGQLTPPRVPGNLPANETEAIALAAENPAVVASIFAERAARDTVDLIAGEKLPTVSLQGDVQRSDESQTVGFRRDTADILAVLSIPLYQAGQTDSRVRQAKQSAGQARIQIDDTLNRAREDITRTFEALTTARARIQALDVQIRANEVALEGVEQEARVGSRTVLDVLDAEQELFQSKVELVRAQADEVSAGYSLSAATGRLTAQALALPVQVYDPTVNYNAVRERWFGTDILTPEKVNPRP